MTFQPPPPPPGAGGPPAKFDPKTVNPLDWGIIGAGVLALIFSLFPYYTASVDGQTVAGTRIPGVSESASAWSGGFFGWAAAIFALAGAVAVALAFFAPQVKLPVPNRLAGLGAFAVATLFVILALFVGGYDDGGFDQIDTGHGFGYWASLIVIIAGLAMSLMRFQATGGQLPGNAGSKVPNVGGYGPQGGLSGGPQPGSQGPQPGYGSQPPAPGYGTQPPPPGYGTQPPPPPAGGPPPPPPGYGPPQ